MNLVPTAVGSVTMIPKVLWLKLTSREEMVPKVALGPFRTDASVYAGRPVSGLRVTWMGHSSMLVEIDGVRVLIDPVWDERASPMQWSGPKRFFAPTLRLEELPELDALLISHDHYDHLGEATIRRLAAMPSMAKVEWITSAGVGAILAGFGVANEKITELEWTESVSLAGLTVTALPSRHFSGRGMIEPV